MHWFRVGVLLTTFVFMDTGVVHWAHTTSIDCLFVDSRSKEEEICMYHHNYPLNKSMLYIMYSGAPPFHYYNRTLVLTYFTFVDSLPMCYV